MVDASEKLAEENAKYAGQVSEMQDRMAEYIQEISALKAQLAEAPAPSPDLKQAEAELLRLRSENSRLMSENTRLNAENGKLRSDVEALRAQSQRQFTVNAPQSRQQPPRLTPHRYRRVIDGYASWN